MLKKCEFTEFAINRRHSHLYGVPGRSPDFRRLPRDLVRSPGAEVEVGVAIVTSYTGMLPSVVVVVVSSVAMTTSPSVTAYTNCSSCVGVGGDLASSRGIPWETRHQIHLCF